MDVSSILAEHAASTAKNDDSQFEIDAGLLTITDPNPTSSSSSSLSESDLLSLAQTGSQALFNTLFSLPTLPSAEGRLAQLPAASFLLPRSKPLPKPKPLTKWEMFAKAKGIQGKSKEKRVKKVWDEEKQEWVNRWGWGGKNKEKEEQWLSEVPQGADVDHDPRKEARDERKQRVEKNEKQRQANLARAQKELKAGAGDREKRKVELERSLATTRTSTASMGKFDRKLDGEKKLKGVKRKFDAPEGSIAAESKASLDLFERMNSDTKKERITEAQRPSKKSKTSKASGPTKDGEESVLNVRKAVRFASKGRGGVALGREKAKAAAGKFKRR